MIKTLLIANRGEIACRIARTAREMGIRTVAVYSEADAGAPHVKACDQAVLIGPAPVADSYLNVESILSAAARSDADAIHPGYGFLSENAGFAEAVIGAGLIFVGPPASAIEAMGDKARAKRAMIEAGVPVVPGYQGEDQSDARLLLEAEKIGFPIMVKAAAGGGGRGMRLVEEARDLPDALTRARAEAESAFGAGDLILERAIQRPRHVEIQIFADAHGGCIHLGERDCSVQRRHQKVLEEAPCPVMTDALRAEMGGAAVAAARAVDYRGAGTVEFLLDDQGFYFLEMNTRLQVEHPVTEMVTGLDLVNWQLRIAAGDALPLTQAEVVLTGHAIEARLYAEDPAAGFLPLAGPVTLWRPATAARVDAGVEAGGDVSAHYDPMVAKIIAHGPDRETARRRLIDALGDTALLGAGSNREFLIDALGQPAFAKGAATTAFIGETYGEAFAPRTPKGEEIALAAALLLAMERDQALRRALSVAPELLGWASAGVLRQPMDLIVGDDEMALMIEETAVVKVSVADQSYHVETLDWSDNELTGQVDGHRLSAHFTYDVEAGLDLAFPEIALKMRRKPVGAGAIGAAGDGRVTAPMHGLLLDIRVKEGDAVAAGETLAVLEAMKMQHEITAMAPGRVSTVMAGEGAQLAAGDLILELEMDEMARAET